MNSLLGSQGIIWTVLSRQIPSSLMILVNYNIIKESSGQYVVLTHKLSELLNV
jgi:hypothetical protein